MSLKALHIVFVVSVALMALACGAWALYEYFDSGAGVAHLFGGLLSIASAAATVVYGRFVLKKLNKISYL